MSVEHTFVAKQDLQLHCSCDLESRYQIVLLLQYYIHANMKIRTHKSFNENSIFSRQRGLYDQYCYRITRIYNVGLMKPI